MAGVLVRFDLKLVLAQLGRKYLPHDQGRTPEIHTLEV